MPAAPAWRPLPRQRIEAAFTHRLNYEPFAVAVDDRLIPG